MNKLLVALGLAATLSGITGAHLAAQQSPAAAAYKRDVPARLLAQTKISEDSARTVALARVPGATVTALELEREGGRLIWSFEADGQWVEALPHQDDFIDAAGTSLDLAKAARVKLWHPMQSTSDRVLAWRRRLQIAAVTQPFKQAHREVYLVTDAEKSHFQVANMLPDKTTFGMKVVGERIFSEIKREDIDLFEIYDDYPIAVMIQIEDFGYCKKGEGGRFVADGNLISGVGKLPINTDGGGLCNNHPGNRGGMTKIIEAVRQLRGEAHPKVQVKNCDLAIAHGTGGLLGVRHAASTCILERA